MSAPIAPAASTRRVEPVGLLFFGDPHLASRPPGYRVDSYQEDILAKLAWGLDYARAERLKPILLGDLFHWPRDNANALVVALLRLFGALDEPLAMIAGNHDMRHAPLREEDTLAILATAGIVRILDDPLGPGPWAGSVAGRRVVLGGTSWGSSLPTKALPDAARRLVDDASAETADDLFAPGPLVVWLTHHDLAFPNAAPLELAESAASDEATPGASQPNVAGRERIEPRPAPELAGVDIAVNGHIHRPIVGEAGVAGRTHWFNPGNIARLTRSASTRERNLGLLRIDVAPTAWAASRVAIPLRPFAEVFHDSHLADQTPDSLRDGEMAGDSSFVRGLEALRSRRTAGGQGLWDFLDANLGDVGPAVAEEIRSLAKRALAEAGVAEEPAGSAVDPAAVAPAASARAAGEAELAP